MTGTSIGTGLTLLIPTVKSMYDSLQVVDRLTKDKMRSLCGTNLQYEWLATTVAAAYLENSFKTLAIQITKLGYESSVVNINNLLVMTPSVRRNTEAEKEGNINMVFKQGSMEPLVPALAPTGTLKLLSPTDPNMFNILDLVDKTTKVEVYKKYGITVSDSWLCTTIASYYIESMYEYVTSKVTDPSFDSKVASINLFDDIEIYGAKHDDTVKISIHPGVDAKLFIKCDALTEEEDD